MLKKNEILEAEILELLSDQEFLIAVKGELHRVRNESGIALDVGQKVKLEVNRVAPLGFRLFAPRHSRSEIDLLV